MILFFNQVQWESDIKLLKHKINSRIFTEKDVPLLMSVLYKQHLIEKPEDNKLLNELIGLLPNIAYTIAKFYNIDANKVFVGDYINDEDCPYELVIGNIYGAPNKKYSSYYSYTKSTIINPYAHTIKSADNLKVLIGNFYCPNNKIITRLPNLELVTGSMICDDSFLANIPNLKIVGGDAFFRNTPIRNFNATFVGGYLDCKYSRLAKADNLQYIGRGANINYCTEFMDEDKIKLAKQNIVKIEKEPTPVEEKTDILTSINKNIDSSKAENQKTIKDTIKNKLSKIKEKLLNE